MEKRMKMEATSNRGEADKDSYAKRKPVVTFSVTTGFRFASCDE
jgi:hypothetical protein